MDKNIIISEDFKIRRYYDEKKEIWYFSVIDIIAVLTDQLNFQIARKYWNKLKERLKKEGNESVTNCHQLKLVAEDGKMRETDVADSETIFRLIQSVPSPKAEPIKLWLAKVGHERIHAAVRCPPSIFATRFTKIHKSQKNLIFQDSANIPSV